MPVKIKLSSRAVTQREWPTRIWPESDREAETENGANSVFMQTADVHVVSNLALFSNLFFPCCHWGKSRSQSRKQAFQIYTLTAKTQIGFTRGGHLAVGYVFLTVINSSAECISSSLTSTGKKNTKWKLGIKAARRGPINLEFLTTTVGPEFIGNIAQLKPRRVLATFGFGVCRSVACRGAPTTFHILRKEIVSEVVRWASFDQQSSTGRLGTVSL